MKLKGEYLTHGAYIDHVHRIAHVVLHTLFNTLFTRKIFDVTYTLIIALTIKIDEEHGVAKKMIFANTTHVGLAESFGVIIISLAY